MNAFSSKYSKMGGLNLRSHLALWLPSIRFRLVCGKVVFLSSIPRTELVDLYHSAGIFVFAPIWGEGFGIPPVEPWAVGVSVGASCSVQSEKRSEIRRLDFWLSNMILMHWLRVSLSCFVMTAWVSWDRRRCLYESFAWEQGSREDIRIVLKPVQNRHYSESFCRLDRRCRAQGTLRASLLNKVTTRTWP
jgi:hypothetical protein